MQKKTAFLLLALAFALAAESDGLSFTYGYWDFDKDNLKLGFDLSGSAGYSIPLNLNNKPVNRDIGENFEAVNPSFSARAGLGILADEDDKLPLHMTIGAEFSHSAFQSDDLDLALFGFALSTRSSIFPCKHLSIVNGKATGLYFLRADPEAGRTGTFADYTSDVDARTDKVHLFDTKEIGLGVAFGKDRSFELSLSGRFDTYYPRFLFWKECVRGAVYTAIQNGASEIAEQTDVWPLLLVGDAVVVAMEMFNLNFYPDAVGITHQHIITPSASLTIRF